MNLIGKKELTSRLFLQYGMCLKIEDKEEYDINSVYKFTQRNPTLNKNLKEINLKLYDVLYRNIYWIWEDEVIEEVYKLQEDFDKYQMNEDIIFMISTQKGETITFKPDYINVENNSILHFFDRSYYLSDGENPREILQNILDYFEREDTYTLEILEYLDYEVSGDAPF